MVECIRRILSCDSYGIFTNHNTAQYLLIGNIKCLVYALMCFTASCYCLNALQYAYRNIAIHSVSSKVCFQREFYNFLHGFIHLFIHFYYIKSFWDVLNLFSLLINTFLYFHFTPSFSWQTACHLLHAIKLMLNWFDFFNDDENKECAFS